MKQIAAFIAVAFFAFPAFAGEELNGLITKLCDKTVLSCDGDQYQNTLSHGAINDRIERMGAVTMATDFHRADETQDNHLIFNIANVEGQGHATAFGLGFIRDFGTTGWSAGVSLATDVNANDQAYKATVGYSW